MTIMTHHDERVKGLTFADGYLHIDLLDGMRLSGPFQADREGKAASRSRLSTTPPSFYDEYDDDQAEQG